MINKKEVKFEYMRGQGKGGQHKNKTDSCVRATHIPTGLSVTIDGRHQHKNKKKALKILEERIEEQKLAKQAKIKKDKRDAAIKDKRYIRTYDYKSQTVKDHRTGKVAPLKEVMGKGRIDLLR
jgi:peptide chain release factor 1